ncbi:hypothetical protein GCM10010495_36830 [Kitasatospora herbaricolor]|nr:hypothetical protein GCM10010495_36830 [Kitasatospora herbaricolor]
MTGVGGERQSGQQAADLLLDPAEVGVVPTDCQLHGPASPASPATRGGRRLAGAGHPGQPGRAAPVPSATTGALVTGMSGPSRER